MTSRRYNREASKRGVALIVTVGFLAVLILMAVAFSVSMRVERLAARNFSDVIQARQWAQSALSRAMQDLDVRVGDQMRLPDSDLVIASAGGAQVYLYTNSAQLYVPASLRGDAHRVVPQWIDGKDSADKTVARYAYQIFDCSGFLDPNFGGASNLVPSARGIATNGFDLWISHDLLSEVVAGKEVDLKEGLRQRSDIAGPPPTGGNTSPWYEFSSLADFWFTVGSTNYGAGLLTEFPRNFFPYSRFPVGYLVTNVAVPTVGTNVFVGFEAKEWDVTGAPVPRGRMEPEFVKMGLSQAQAWELAACVADYCDSDNFLSVAEPTNACTEATPLINEVTFEGRWDAANSRLTIKPRIELWFPFAGTTNTAQYRVAIVITNWAPVPDLKPGIPPAINSGRYQYVGDVTRGSWQYNDFWTTVDTLPDAVATGTPPANFNGYYVDIDRIILQDKAGGGRMVDGVRNLRVPLQFLTTDGAAHSGGKAVNDPRLNAYTNQWVDTVAGGGTPTSMGAFNTGVCNPGAVGQDFEGVGGTPFIYIANRPLRSVGELGMVGHQTNRPWSTIRLLGDGAFPVLDRFALITNPPVRHGMININTWNESVLATAFNAAPTDRYPGEPAAAALNVAAAQSVASTIRTRTQTTLFRNLSEIASVGPTLGSLDRLQSEGIVRNSSELLGVRQQVFTILFAAQSLADSGSNVMGEQRGIAVIWRDPYRVKDADGQDYHPAFVRFFRWLDD